MRLVYALFALAALGLGVYATATRSGWTPPREVPAGAGGGSAAGGGVSAPPDGVPPVDVQTSVRRYRVVGQTPEAVFRSLVASGPRNGDRAFFGMTESDMGLQYRTAESAEGCWLADVRVRLTVTTTLPEWEGATAAPSGMHRDWTRFLDALERHEAEHGALAVRGVEKVRAAVEGLRRPTCAEVEAEARRRLSRIEIEIEASHRRYDEQTGHGHTEGAVWPPR